MLVTMFNPTTLNRPFDADPVCACRIYRPTLRYNAFRLRLMDSPLFLFTCRYLYYSSYSRLYYFKPNVLKNRLRDLFVISAIIFDNDVFELPVQYIVRVAEIIAFWFATLRCQCKLLPDDFS